jgi:hypothetical protein
MIHLPVRPKAGRLITAAGAVVAACTISSTAYAATYTPATHTAPAVAACTGASDLTLKIPVSQERTTGGIKYYTLEFTNKSKSTCAVSGYPSVTMINKSGKQLGSPAGRGLMTIAPLVRLAPGATAHTTLAYRGGMVSTARGCGPVATAYELRVFVAGQKLALYSAMGVHACSRTGHVYMTVTQPFQG